MRYDAKFVRALERQYENKYIRMCDGGRTKRLDVTFWFTHLSQEQMFKYDYSCSLTDNFELDIKSELKIYRIDGNWMHLPWYPVSIASLDKYDFNWDHPKLRLAKRCMYKDVQHTHQEVMKYAKQIEEFNEKHNDRP